MPVCDGTTLALALAETELTWRDVFGIRMCSDGFEDSRSKLESLSKDELRSEAGKNRGGLKGLVSE